MLNHGKGMAMCLLLVTALLVCPEVSWAQSVTTHMSSIKGKVIQVAQVVFIILMVIGAIKAVKEFISQSPKAWNYLVMLIVGAMVYFGLSTIVNDMSSLGGINAIKG